MPLTIIRNDIAKVKADVIVNSANPKPICGRGADYSIYQAAGYDQLLAARQAIGDLNVADIAVTPAFALDAKYIIHTVGPVWNNGASGELFALRQCYLGALQKAVELGAKSIAFPLISSGVYRFPKDQALQIATDTISAFLQTNEIDATIVVHDSTSLELSKQLIESVGQFIDENYIEPEPFKPRRYGRSSLRLCELAGGDLDDACEATSINDNNCDAALSMYWSKEGIASGKNLEDFLKNDEDSFQQRLFRFIQERNLDDVKVYTAANLDRKHFSKIRSNVNYRPTKRTALALAISLHLNIDETRDLLSRAELALSPSNKGDVIVTFFIENQKYDIWTINNVLMSYHQETLGAK